MATPKNPDICRAVRAAICENKKPFLFNAKSIAAAMGLRDEFAAYELANAESTQHVYAEHVVSLFLCSGRDPRVFDEMARQVGGIFVDLEPYRDGKGEKHLAQVMEYGAAFFKEAAKALRDGKVTAAEKDEMDRRARVAIAAIVAFLERA